MSCPTVAAVMLVNGRPEMVKRAIASFQAQTYPEKILVIYDTTPETTPTVYYPNFVRAVYEWPEHGAGHRSIGELRNAANGHVDGDEGEEIIIHWDSDDVSHPNRIAEQVALLQASGKECVGYRDMLFWREPMQAYDAVKMAAGIMPWSDVKVPGEAWLYTNAQPSYCLGTSLAYWRSVWEKRPFADLPKGPMGMGEDHQWLSGVDSRGISSLLPGFEPSMIASVHGSNSTDIMRVAIQVKDKMLRRTPEWDAYCRERMAL